MRFEGLGLEFTPGLGGWVGGLGWEFRGVGVGVGGLDFRGVLRVCGEFVVGNARMEQFRV